MRKFFDRALSAVIIALAAALILMYGNLARMAIEENRLMAEIQAEYMEMEGEQ